MVEITAVAVKSLRDRTGAGMMDCKRALAEAEGDEERAIDLLRQRGVVKAAKRAGRETSEGTVQIAESERTVVMVEVLSETDFVARSDEFTAFARSLAERAVELGLPDGEILDSESLFECPEAEGLEDDLNQLRLKVGENVRVSRVAHLSLEEGATLGSYLHFGNRIGVLVELTGAADPAAARAAARGIAMHIAATSPAGVSPEDIPAEVVERERAVLVEQAKEEGKPPEIAEKIVEGRLRKFFEQHALLMQDYVKEPDRKVKDVVAESGEEAHVRRFVRFEIGS